MKCPDCKCEMDGGDAWWTDEPPVWTCPECGEEVQEDDE